MGCMFSDSPLHYDGVTTWRGSPHTWPCVRGIHQSSVYSPHKNSIMRSFEAFFVGSPNKLVEERVKLPVIWGAMARMLRNCNDKDLTHLGRVMHTCVGKLAIISSDNGLSPGQAPGHYLNQCRNILFIWTLGTNFGEILSEMHTSSFKKMHLNSRLGSGGHFVLASMCYGQGNACTARDSVLYGFLARNTQCLRENWSSKVAVLGGIICTDADWYMMTS